MYPSIQVFSSHRVAMLATTDEKRAEDEATTNQRGYPPSPHSGIVESAQRQHGLLSLRARLEMYVHTYILRSVHYARRAQPTMISWHIQTSLGASTRRRLFSSRLGTLSGSRHRVIECGFSLDPHLILLPTCGFFEASLARSYAVHVHILVYTKLKGTCRSLAGRVQAYSTVKTCPPGTLREHPKKKKVSPGSN